MAGPLTVDVVAPDRVLWSGTAERVIAPSVEGEIGLLTGHQPTLAVLAPGTVRVHGGVDGDADFVIAGGFVSFDYDIVTVVVEERADAPAAEEPVES